MGEWGIGSREWGRNQFKIQNSKFKNFCLLPPLPNPDSSFPLSTPHSPLPTPHSPLPTPQNFVQTIKFAGLSSILFKLGIHTRSVQ
ncbi:hypothetical protein GXM_01128 [Nostoc sphaeroides CCNUC1]|uniref:Uncharacterized protein n=1 Tax=Nostoc sphaeroides CCNUC1 TaxID=2653204 RepID=A0A5P8VT85_9NOSO|nr:hypothetical protein GXM_01128 [Nostoc sphaeroides CCNUC1]